MGFGSRSGLGSDGTARGFGRLRDIGRQALSLVPSRSEAKPHFAETAKLTIEGDIAERSSTFAQCVERGDAFQVIKVLIRYVAVWTEAHITAEGAFVAFLTG
jgi:hypothetical protein